ncbi:MAG: DUF192 domain-containing protein [Phycisphaerales bacterium]
MAARLRRALCTAPLAAALLGATLTLTACTEAPPPGFERVTLDGRTFTLEVVADDDSRMKGLGDRRSLPDDGGMLFVFPDSVRRQFVMRDCYIDIDIIFLDASASIVAMHHMVVEDPRREGETDAEYEGRLVRYPSRFGSEFVIELKGGVLEGLDLKEGEAVDLDVKRLRSMAK